MKPFEQAYLPPHAFDADKLAAMHKCTREQALAAIEAMRDQLILMNDRYQVNVSKIKQPFGPAMGDVAWLSIKRRDKATIHDWRELQTIKNEVIGAEHEGFEIYPAESRLVDTANQYHMWVFMDPAIRMPVGFRERMVLTPEDIEGSGARQRAFEVT